jgi:LacI family transcriptional regulator
MHCTEHGIAVDDKLIAYGEPDEIGGETGDGRAAGAGVKTSPRSPATTTQWPPVPLSVLSDNSVDVPGQMSLIGFDDVLISRYLRPRLTTMRYPVVAMANPGGAAGAGTGERSAAAGDHQHVQPDAGAPSFGGQHQ